MIVQEQDPVTAGSGFGLMPAFQEKTRTKCADLASTRKLALELDRLIVQYNETTGKPMDDIIKVTVLHGAMDSETAREMARNMKEGEEPSYKDAREYIEKLYRVDASRMVPEQKAQANSLVNHYCVGEQPDSAHTQEWSNDLSAIKGGKGE